MSTFDNLGKTVAKFAPLLGSILPIPGGALIGQAIADAFGGDAAKPHELEKKIKADPDAAIKLKAIELNNKLELEKLKQQYENAKLSAVLRDKHSARQMAIDLAKSRDPSQPLDHTPRYIAYATFGGFLAALTGLFFLQIDTNIKDALMLLLGVLGTKVSSIVDFYFGSSNT